MTKPCPSCTAPNPREAAFCQNCAAPFAAAQPPSPIMGPPVIGQPGAVGESAGASLPAGGGHGQKALIALILAIAALLCCGPFTGIPAAVVGWLELDAIRQGRSPQGGRWMAQTGLWLGIAASVIHVVLAVLLFALGLVAGSDPYGYDYGY